MAYGNWGAFVYRNGERMRSHEDATPYRETELEPGYHQAFRRREGYNPHHAVLGSQRVRLCGYKSGPVLFLDGERQKLDTTGWYDRAAPLEGEIDGYRWRATHISDPESVELWLQEPDGTQWTSRCGYLIGAGHQD